jgi:O-antigen ligase
MASNGRLYWVRAPRFAGWVYGPYVNHNNYAGLMELLLPIPLVIALSHFVRGARKAMAGAAAAIITTSVFLSGSRGGMAAVAIEIGLLIAAIAYRERKDKSKKLRGNSIVLAAFVILVVGLVTWLGGGKLAERMASIQTETRTELSGGTRLDIDRDALQMFRARPYLGWGLGVFPEVFPQFQTFYSTFFVNDAHNDYLQLLAEMGVAGVLAVLWFLFLTYRRACSKLANWPSDTNGTLALTAILGVTGILVHSFVDFNLQIPANAAIFYMLCTAAAMEPRFALTRRTLRRSSDIIPLAPDAATGQF